MEYIKKEELKDGDIFVTQLSHTHFLNKYGTGFNLNLKTDNTIRSERLYKNGVFVYNNMRLATSEEKHWLNECIKLNKFITFEEAMKTFIPEYVEWIDNIGSDNLGYQIKDHFKKNKIFKTDAELPSHGFQTQDWITHLKIYPNNYKPSTKEAYDAQFVVKEPEFVLPEKWCIFRNNEHFEEIGRWFNKINNDDSYTNSIIKSNYPYLNNSGIQGNCLSTTLINGYIEITFEQFKKYVLKEEIVEEKVIEPLPQFKVIETIETITKVENNEGNQFFIGDEVISSKTKIKSKIISFKYNVDKTAILAITDKRPNIGIGINHLEHYIEPKVEETLLEKAKRLYPVGTKFINPNGNKECVIKEKGDYFKGNNNNIYHSLKSDIYKYDEGLSGCIYMNNTWSKIIE